MRLVLMFRRYSSGMNSIAQLIGLAILVEPLAFVDVPDASAAAIHSSRTADLSSRSEDVSTDVSTPTGETRGKPRVSKTRCAIIGCGPQCNAIGAQDAQGGLPLQARSDPAEGQAISERSPCTRRNGKAVGERARDPD